MNISDLRQLSEGELQIRIGTLREEIYNLRFQKATRQSANPKQAIGLRREIARIYTVLREHALGIRPLGAAEVGGKNEAAGESV
ncbi:MAG: 50S ribosomal protein L29 [candidate division Zixibacteria bacterium]|nr:50S ribosomal protein L29 [candidate division Zixibacteria bacterium]